MFKHATPIFRSFDEKLAREFYIDFLEFEVVFEHRFEPNTPLYLGLVRDHCTLHLSEHFGDGAPGAQLRIEVDDVDAMCTQLNAKRYRNARPSCQDMPWGSRQMTINDPFGNRITFYSEIE